MIKPHMNFGRIFKNRTFGQLFNERTNLYIRVHRTGLERVQVYIFLKKATLIFFMNLGHSDHDP